MRVNPAPPASEPHLHFRPAAIDEVGLLTGLALRSKAHWGYAKAQLEVWAPQLEVAPAWVAMRQVHVALIDEVILGFFVVLGGAGQWRLEHLWVEPAAMGKGIGRALLERACRLARSLGACELMIDADPNAEGFYLACGAQRVAALAAPIDNAPSRTLPVMRLRCDAPQPRREAERDVP